MKGGCDDKPTQIIHFFAKSVIDINLNCSSVSSLVIAVLAYLGFGFRTLVDLQSYDYGLTASSSLGLASSDCL